MACELLTPAQMGDCDRFAIDAGTPGALLMEAAGRAVADEAVSMVPPGSSILVLAGPGNNGGDGYVAARHLAGAGHTVAVSSLGDPAALGGDARNAFEQWAGDVFPAQAILPRLPDHALIIDALFGAGLARSLKGEAAGLIAAVNTGTAAVLAVDLPSGIDGTTGQVRGVAIKADRTITFHRLKLGHALFPGRVHCGTVRCTDIGLSERALDHAGYSARLTGDYLVGHVEGRWRADLHKYHRGHALIVGGPPERIGAAFLAGNAALRAGAGLVTLALPAACLVGSLGIAPQLLRAECNTAGDLSQLLADRRISCCALGPGLSPDEVTRQMVYAAIDGDVALVLDAGALTAFSGQTETLFERIKNRQGPVVLTPHEGEVGRLFGRDKLGEATSRFDAGCDAAERSGATVVLKGPDSVIAAPDGGPQARFINGNAPPWLATAGSGDVLTGILAGLLAAPRAADRSMDSIAELVALSVWLHGEAGQVAGPSLTAGELEPALKQVLNQLFTRDPENAFRPLIVPTASEL
ncbi:MAG: NAD(P)H-hydrate dehydratase [Cohaesibacteraceae bacterium]